MKTAFSFVLAVLQTSGNQTGRPYSKLEEHECSKHLESEGEGELVYFQLME